MTRYFKVMFSRSDLGCTAALVVSTETCDPQDVSALSRLYPAYEAPKMRRVHVSPLFASTVEARAYVFPCDTMGNPIRSTGVGASR